jgi:hypothetical protein
MFICVNFNGLIYNLKYLCLRLRLFAWHIIFSDKTPVPESYNRHRNKSHLFVFIYAKNLN